MNKKDRTVYPQELIIPMDPEAKIKDIVAIVKCPNCGKTHCHGWGTGWREPGCLNPGGQYYLVCGNKTFTAKVKVK